MKVIFYKDKWTEKNLKKMGLNGRQIKAVLYVKEKGKITNQEYRQMFSVSKPTATCDLGEIKEKKIFEAKDTGKRNVHYVIKPKMSQERYGPPKALCSAMTLL